MLLALLVNATVLDHFRIFGARPDLMIVCVTFFGLFLGRAAGLETGLVAPRTASIVENTIRELVRRLKKIGRNGRTPERRAWAGSSCCAAATRTPGNSIGGTG